LAQVFLKLAASVVAFAFFRGLPEELASRMGGKGKGKARDDYRSYENSSQIDRFPKVAEKLEHLRDNLPEQAAKAYHALQLALQPHSRAYGSRPQFEEDFHHSLSALFPRAQNITARQIGAWNQWEVKIDNGPRMFCSVRLEVLTDDPTFLKDLKNKAKVVKDTLFEDHGKWKKQLQPGKDFNFEKLGMFERECAHRTQYSDNMGGSRQRGASRERTGWVDETAKCPICHKSMEEDNLKGQHMCVVFGFFQCHQCRSTWTSYHARLKPDHETIMNQQCSRCQCNGVVKDWRVIESKDEEHYQTRSQKSGMHQSELCDACREFGNCMGVFYDPFVLTTALSLVSGQYVQWRSFSEEMPELLIADLGPSYKDLQVCLQPHVYMAPDEDGYSYPDDDSYASYQPPMHSKGAGKKGKRYDAYTDSDYDRSSISYSMGGGYPGRVDETCDESEEEFVVQRTAPRQSHQEQFRNRPRDKNSQFTAPAKGTGGVKDAARYDKFLNSAGHGSKQSGPGSFGHAGPATASIASTSSRYPPASEEGSLSEQPQKSALAARGRGVGSTMFSSEVSSDAGSSLATSQPLTHGPAAESVPKVSKFNKMGKVNRQPSQNAPTVPTPILDALPPLRRAQLLQVVLRQVKATGGSDADKLVKAEEYLASNNGDYDKAYQYVKSLADGAS
jgi:hypothetical protein